MAELDLRETGKRRIGNSNYRQLFKRIFLLTKAKKYVANGWTSEVKRLFFGCFFLIPLRCKKEQYV